MHCMVPPTPDSHVCHTAAAIRDAMTPARIARPANFRRLMGDHWSMTSARTAALPTSWQAPVADRPVRGTVAVPGSKSLTNRALILAAQATVPSRIVAPLRSRDTELMAAGLRAIGVRIDSAANSADPLDA